MGGGLTNRPFIKNMQPVLLSEDVQLEEHQDNSGFIYISNTERDEDTLNKKLLGILKLDENATEDQVSEAVNKVIEDNENLTKEVETKTAEVAEKEKEIETKTTENTKLSETIKTLTNNKSDLEKDNMKFSERITSIEPKLVDTEWEQVSSKLLSEGKLTPVVSEKLKPILMKDKNGTVALMEALPKVVDLGEVGSSRGKSEVESNVKLFEQKVKEIMSRDNISYVDALPLAEIENKELFSLADTERGVK